MEEAFIIMQIGDATMDRTCDEAFVPAIEAAGLVPRRVDRDNEGGLLKSEIIDFLLRSQIIVADLTNERPNCYLEVGYALGLGKNRNLLLTAREDHHHRSPSYRSDGPRVHFDLEGYELLFWDPNQLDAFRGELENRVRRRVAILEPPAPGEPDGTPQQRGAVVDEEWLATQHEQALLGLESISRSAYMEAAVALHPKGSWGQAALLAAVEGAQVKTFGWPIGVVMNRDSWRPRPTSEGIKAEIAIAEGDDRLDRASYDYWYLRQTGDFYLLQSLFEDERTPNSLFFDTRIVRATELLLFLSRCYARLEVPDSTTVKIDLTHGGLGGRHLVSSGSRLMHGDYASHEDTVAATTECTVAQLQSDLVRQVRNLLEPVFVVFDFFQLSDDVWEDIVDKFVAGRID